MHAKWMKAAVLPTLCLLLAGCGTLVTQFDEKDRYTFPGSRQRNIPQVYSGTAADLVFAKDVMFETTGATGEEQGAECCFSPFYLVVDLPLSFVADTILLPYTIWKQIFQGSIWKSSAPKSLMSNEKKKPAKIENKKSAAPR
jgi:uncharacterized protein YceK